MEGRFEEGRDLLMGVSGSWSMFPASRLPIFSSCSGWGWDEAGGLGDRRACLR